MSKMLKFMNGTSEMEFMQDVAELTISQLKPNDSIHIQYKENLTQQTHKYEISRDNDEYNPTYTLGKLSNMSNDEYEKIIKCNKNDIYGVLLLTIDELNENSVDSSYSIIKLVTMASLVGMSLVSLWKYRYHSK